MTYCVPHPSCDVSHDQQAFIWDILLEGRGGIYLKEGGENANFPREGGGKVIMKETSLVWYLCDVAIGTRRVLANEVYQQYIKDKNHYHMNATRVSKLRRGGSGHYGKEGVSSFV